MAESDDSKPPAADGPRPPAVALSLRMLCVVAAPFLVWAAAMTLAMLARALSGAPGAAVWLHVLREGSVAAFLLATAVSVVLVIRREARERRGG